MKVQAISRCGKSPPSESMGFEDGNGGPSRGDVISSRPPSSLGLQMKGTRTRTQIYKVTHLVRGPASSQATAFEPNPLLFPMQKFAFQGGSDQSPPPGRGGKKRSPT